METERRIWIENQGFTEKQIRMVLHQRGEDANMPLDDAVAYIRRWKRETYERLLGPMLQEDES